MRKWSILSVAVVFLTAGCGDLSLLQPGDTVSPRIASIGHWEAGQVGMLRVELYATDGAGNSRRLGFGASPDIDPVAHVQFFDAGGKAIESLNVELSTRC